MIRRLEEHDGAAFWKLRLEALESEPGAFAESAAEFRGSKSEECAERFRLGGADNFVMGLFEDSMLTGTAGFYRERRERLRHKGRIWGVYVTPEYRGRGSARRLLAEVIEAARTLPGLDSISLSVAVPQEAARRVYLSLGFERFGIEPRSLRVGDSYIPEEHYVLPLQPPLD